MPRGMNTEPVRVEAYSSYRYAVEPRAFTAGPDRRAVVEVGRAWRDPGRLHFYVRDDQDEFSELIYDEAADSWSRREFGKDCPPRFM